MNERLKKIISDELKANGIAEDDVLACKLANRILMNGYGLVGFCGPAQLFAFESQVQGPQVDPCVNT